MVAYRNCRVNAGLRYENAALFERAPIVRKHELQRGASRLVCTNVEDAEASYFLAIHRSSS
jgi:hypothetical protein